MTEVSLSLPLYGERSGACRGPEIFTGLYSLSDGVLKDCTTVPYCHPIGFKIAKTSHNLKQSRCRSSSPDSKTRYFSSYLFSALNQLGSVL